MKLIGIIICWSLILILAGCENWLDVEPENSISSEELYSTGEGFRNQLNGAYKELSSTGLYGRELSWGFLDVLGQYYNSSTLSTIYADVSNFSYEVDGVKTSISSIWKNMFHVVVNCNQALENLDTKSESLFELGVVEKDLLKGEFLALRAFVHFDLLRLFAPSPKSGESGVYIPYVKNSENTVNVPLSVEDVLKNVIDDFESARQLVSVYDTTEMEGFPSENDWKNVSFRLKTNTTSTSLFFMGRGYRMNYYAITALLARVHAYQGNMVEAYKYAKEIYDKGYFKFTDFWNITSDINNRNRKLYDDIIWGLMNQKMAEAYENTVYSINSSTLALRYPEDIFGGGNTNDYRYNYLLTGLKTSRVLSVKNFLGSETEMSLISEQVIPVIRLSELYYIMGEYLAGSADQADRDEAVRLLESLRSARGETVKLPGIENSTDILKAYQDLVLEDARREFICEGQIFYMYKRLNRPLFDGKLEFDLEDKYYFPIPEGESVLL